MLLYLLFQTQLTEWNDECVGSDVRFVLIFVFKLTLHFVAKIIETCVTEEEHKYDRYDF